MIVLVGKMGSGKDTVAEVLKNKYNFNCKAIAEPIKQIVGHLRNNELGKAHKMFYDLTSGDVPETLYSDLIEMQKIPEEKPKDRKIYQYLGTDYGRRLDKNIWVNHLISHLFDPGNVVVTDCRFASEFERLYRCFPLKSIFIEVSDNIRLERLKQRDKNFDESCLNHVSETEIDSLKGRCSEIINNDGSLKDLAKQIDNIFGIRIKRKKPKYDFIDLRNDLVQEGPIVSREEDQDEIISFEEYVSIPRTYLNGL